MNNKQYEALIFANDRPDSTSDDLYQWSTDAEDLIRIQHARIVELEVQLAATQPAAHGMEEKLIDFIEDTGDVRFSRCRIGSIKGPIRWDVEFGNDYAVRGKTLQESIAKALAAQAKQAKQTDYKH